MQEVRARYGASVVTKERRFRLGAVAREAKQAWLEVSTASDPHDEYEAMAVAVAEYEASAMRWVVVVGAGVWAKCYGPFVSHDEVMKWVRASQFDVEDCHAFPVEVVKDCASV